MPVRRNPEKELFGPLRRIDAQGILLTPTEQDDYLVDMTNLGDYKTDKVQHLNYNLVEQTRKSVS